MRCTRCLTLALDKADAMTTTTLSAAACDSTPQSSAQALRQNLARSLKKLVRNPLSVAGLIVIGVMGLHASLRGVTA